MIETVADKPERGTLADIVRLEAAGQSVELIDGEIVYKTGAAATHGNIQAGLAGAITGFRGRLGGPRGPGGWWIFTEVSIFYPTAEEVFAHDLSGYRRERMPEVPSGVPVRLRPDWAAEVLSPSTARYDLVKKQRTLHLHGVPHYWVLDPQHELLTVLRHTPDGYLQVLTAGVGDVVRAEPFDAVEIAVADLFGKD